MLEDVPEKYFNGDYTMKLKALVVALLATASMAAHAEMTAMADQDLSAVSGQDGVSIAANLNANIGSFTYTNTDATTGGSVSFNGIHATGLIAATIDVINAATFNQTLTAAGVGGTFFGQTVSGSTVTGTDVVQIGFPSSTTLTTSTGTPLLSISTDSITMGHSTASFGSMALNSIDLRGTTVWLWAH